MIKSKVARLQVRLPGSCPCWYHVSGAEVEHYIVNIRQLAPVLIYSVIIGIAFEYEAFRGRFG